MTLSATALVDLTQAKSFLHIDAAASLRADAEYVGLGDGVDKVFDLDYAPVEGSLRVYVNGALKVQPTDYSISGVTITFVSPPGDGLSITASYDRTASVDTFESFDDALLERMIDAATKKAEDYTGRAFVQREITEDRIGDGSEILRLYRRPVVSPINSVTLDGIALTEGSDYTDISYIGRLRRTSKWTEGYHIVVVYTAGYGATRAEAQAAVPDVALAVLLIISDLYENRGDKVDSASVDGIGSASYKLPSRAAELLNFLRVDIC